jgi:ribosomal protein S18 acetylase RimI-like enzyme
MEISMEQLSKADGSTLFQLALLEITAWGGNPDEETVDARKLRLANELGKLDPNEKCILLVRKSEAILGVCRVAQERQNTKAWLIYGLAVHPDHRRIGLARILVQDSIRFARSHGARNIRSETHSDNAASIAMHKALGFVDERMLIAPDGDEKIAFSIALVNAEGT